MTKKIRALVIFMLVLCLGGITAYGAQTYELKSVKEGDFLAAESQIEIPEDTDALIMFYDYDAIYDSLDNMESISSSSMAEDVSGLIPAYSSFSNTKLPADTTVNKWKVLKITCDEESGYRELFLAAVPEYKITYELDGGTNASGNPSSYEYGAGVSSFDAPTKIGYVFDGWYTASDFKNKITSISNTATGDMELYARFSVDQLPKTKEEAITVLRNYKYLSSYRSAQQSELKTAISNGESAINAAKTADAVAEALKTAKASIDKIKTDAQLSAEEAKKTLDKAKTDALNTLKDKYNNRGEYQVKQEKEHDNAYNAGINAINNAETVEEVKNALQNAQNAMDSIKTAKQMRAEISEAKAEKTATTATIKSKKSDLKGSVFKITNSKTVAFTIVKTKEISLVLPNHIKWGGKTYALSIVKSKSFKSAKKLKTLTIGRGILAIEKNAFAGSNITALKFVGTQVPKIKDGAFRKSKIKVVYISKKMSKKKFKKFKKALKKAGYKGKILRR